MDGSPYITDIISNQNGLLSYIYANGSKHNRVYDANGQVERLIYPNYTEEINYNVVSSITSLSSNDNNQTFNYDVLGRLTNYKNSTNGEYQNFGYDANGNRLTQNQEINRSRDFTYTTNTNLLTNIKYVHRVDENTTEITKDINYTYDKIGNIIEDDKHIYGYDGRNRLISIDENIKYNYNNNNRRVSKTVDEVTTYFIYAGHMLTGEYDKDGNVINEYIYFGSSVIAMVTSEESYTVYTDHLDTPRRVIDEKSKIVWKWESTPFGETKATGALEFNLRFAGQYFDSETGTHYNINRDYNPVTGRYIQSDPIGLDGGFSTFAYVNGNPVMRVDINGLVDMNFITQNSPKLSFVDTALNYVDNSLIIAAAALYNPKNFFTVLAHGAIGMMFYGDGSPMDKESDLDFIANKARKSGKNSILLISCNAGQGQEYYTWKRKKGYSLPQYLANKSGKSIIASDNFITFAFTTPRPSDNAKWLLWHPER